MLNKKKTFKCYSFVFQYFFYKKLEFAIIGISMSELCKKTNGSEKLAVKS